MSHKTVVYPQAKPFASTDEIEAFLTKPLIAKLCTQNKDGSTHIAPVWFKYENGEFLFGTQEMTHKVRNIKREQRVTILVDGTDPVLQGVIAYGKAQLDFEDVIAKRIRIFEKYIGAENAPGLANKLATSWNPVVIHVKPEKMVTFDYSKGFGISKDSEAEATPLL